MLKMKAGGEITKTLMLIVPDPMVWKTIRGQQVVMFSKTEEEYTA
jgi:hypothetical protein